MKLTLALPFSALLLVAGCGEDPAPAPVEAEPPVDPALVEQEGNAFPAAYEGRWGVDPADCENRGASPEMYYEIAGDTMSAGDRTGTITSMTVDKPGQLTTSIAFSGRGADWTRETRFFLEDEGQTLVRSDREPVSYQVTYSRCADAAEAA